MSETSPTKPRAKAITEDKVQSMIVDAITSTPTLDAEERFLDNEVERQIRIEDLAEKKKHNEILHENKELRKQYAKYIFILTCSWALLIFILIFSIGIKNLILIPSTPFELSDKVVITLITSTTINFFGFFLLVIKYLFYTGHTTTAKTKSKEKEKKKTKSKRTSE